MLLPVVLARIGSPGRWAATLVGVSAFGFLNVAQAQTLGAVEQRLDRLEKTAQELQRQAERRSRSSNARKDVYLQVDRRLGALERAISNLVASQERDRRELTATVEQLKRMKLDVEARLDVVENQPPPRASPAAEAVIETPTVPLGPEARFGQAMSYAEQQDWPNAELAFDTFIASYPSDPRLPDASFQLGRALEGQGKHAQAARTFLALYQAHPDVPFVVDTLFALAEALAAIGPENAEQACDVYGEIDVAHGSKLSVEQRSQLLDGRLSLKCSR